MSAAAMLALVQLGHAAGPIGSIEVPGAGAITGSVGMSGGNLAHEGAAMRLQAIQDAQARLDASRAPKLPQNGKGKTVHAGPNNAGVTVSVPGSPQQVTTPLQGGASDVLSATGDAASTLDPSAGKTIH